MKTESSLQHKMLSRVGCFAVSPQLLIVIIISSGSVFVYCVLPWRACRIHLVGKGTLCLANENLRVVHRRVWEIFAFALEGIRRTALLKLQEMELRSNGI